MIRPKAATVAGPEPEIAAKKQETANMQWPEWIYGAFVPIGAAFAAIAFFQTMLVMCKEYTEQEGEK